MKTSRSAIQLRWGVCLAAGAAVLALIAMTVPSLSAVHRAGAAHDARTLGVSSAFKAQVLRGNVQLAKSEETSKVAALTALAATQTAVPTVSPTWPQRDPTAVAGVAVKLTPISPPVAPPGSGPIGAPSPSAPSTPAAPLTPPAATNTSLPTSVQPFIVFYGGFPSDGSDQLATQVAQSLQGYPIVVYGDWRTPLFLAKIQADLPNTQFFGYAYCNDRTWQHIQQRLELLHAEHYNGVLLDGMGYGYSASTANMQKIVDFAHQEGLRVLINTWLPSTLAGLTLAPGSDGYLCENWVYSDGQPNTRGADVYAELAQMKKTGILIYMIVTMNGAGFTPAQAEQPVADTISAIGGQYISVSGEYYSAQSNAIFPASELTPLITGAAQ